MANTKLNKTQKIISIVVAVILLIVIAGGVYCVSTKQNPIDAAKSVFTSSENQIVGKWQSQKSPGLSAFVFYDDGTYETWSDTRQERFLDSSLIWIEGEYTEVFKKDKINSALGIDVSSGEVASGTVAQ